MRARTPRAPVGYRPSTLAPIRRGRVGLVGPALRPIASAALRSLALLAIAGLLILIVLPAFMAAA